MTDVSAARRGVNDWSDEGPREIGHDWHDHTVVRAARMAGVRTILTAGATSDRIDVSNQLLRPGDSI